MATLLTLRASASCIRKRTDAGSASVYKELLANITLHWATQTIGSSFIPYIAAQRHPPARGGRVQLPTAVAIFPKDLVTAPREYAERFFNVQRWTEMPRGGHFAALEEPELLAADLRAFFRPLQAMRAPAMG